MNHFLAYLKVIICILIFILSMPGRVLSAEVLQVSSSSILQIGDNNRSYKVRIYCINIDPLQDKEAANWLKVNLPRRSKVNILPKGYEDGTLISEVIKIRTNEDISAEMVRLGFGQKNCNP